MRLKTLCFNIVTINLFFTVSCGSGSVTKVSDAPKQGHEMPRPASENWLLSGRLATPGFSNGEMLAIGMDGHSFSTKIGPDDNFDLPLPGNQSYAVYFFPPSHKKPSNVIAASEFIDSAVGPDFSKEGWAMLQFQESSEFGMRETLRLPKPRKTWELDFGNIAIKGNHAIPTKNPANELDFDNDGVIDAADSDDQNDGRDDREQKYDLERVLICHYTSNDSGIMQSIPLALLFSHLSHGDTVGACATAKKPKSEDEKDEHKPHLPKLPGHFKAPVSSKTADKNSAGPLVNPPVVIEETPDEEEPKNAGMVIDKDKVKKDSDEEPTAYHHNETVEEEPEEGGSEEKGDNEHEKKEKRNKKGDNSDRKKDRSKHKPREISDNEER